jgi:dienelactone hydrolase
VNAALIAAIAHAWVGTYQLPASAQPVPIAVDLHGARASVSLGPGHASRQVVPVSFRGGRLRFTLPGGIVFDGGTVRQGRLRGTVSLHRGTSRVLPALGVYRGPRGTGVAIVQAEGLPTWLVDFPSGDVHGLNRTLTTAGSTLGGTAGTPVTVAAGSVMWRGVRYTRLAVRQREIRVGAIAATLTLPPGRGPFPAVVMTHGSGLNARDEFQVFGAWSALLGIAVVADDKRGVGQSGGVYPGEVATPHTLDVLARDAQAEARYLKALPEIDPSRIGILGDSQAGWVIALAAGRERAFRWAVPLAGPTVTVGEADQWGVLAGKGEQPPSASQASMLAQTRAARGGFDPLPWLDELRIPVHWVFTRHDANIPTDMCIERLRTLRKGHDFGWTTIDATHSLFEVPTGFNRDIVRSRGFGTGLFAAIRDFVVSHRIVRR